MSWSGDTTAATLISAVEGIFSLITLIQFLQLLLFLPVKSLITRFRSLTHFAHFVSLFHHYNSSSDSKAFLRFTAFTGSVPVVTNGPLHMDYGITHTFLRRIDLIYGIALWAYFSKPLVKEVTNVVWQENDNIVFSNSSDHTFTVMYVLRRGIRKHCVWRKWLP